MKYPDKSNSLDSKNGETSLNGRISNLERRSRVPEKSDSALNLSPALPKRLVVDEQEKLDSDGGVVMSDVTGTVVAQLDAAVLSGGSGLGGASGLSGLVSGGEAAAAGGAAAASAGAASASVAATTSITSTASVASVGSLSGLAGGLALAAGGGGGGPTITTPAPVPPANPYPGSDPATLDLSAGAALDVHRLTVAGTSLPSLILNKSLVIDLGATSGSLDGTLYHTQRIDGVVVTHVLTYKNIVNVIGTAVNDQITGSAAANVLDGGAGDDVIYGAGGLDTLRGGAGNDWVLFKPLTRSFGSSPYDDGVFLSLAGTDSSLPGVVGIYKNASQTLGAFAEASGFENAVGSSGADVLLGSDVGNVLDGGGGGDVIKGGAGNDTLFDGASGAKGNQLWGGGGSNTFNVGSAINPVVQTVYPDQGYSQAAGTSVLRDWKAGTDTLNVSGVGVAVIGGLGNGLGNWNGDDVVDLRSNVSNLGAIYVAAGAGHNQIYGSSGTDYYWVGYEYLATNVPINASADDQSVIDGVAAPTASAAAVDILWSWDDQSTNRDHLNVAAGSQAVIGGLQGVSGWAGNDIVDLRSGVTNLGSIVVAAGAGNNLLYGSTGDDHFYGSSGTAGTYNQVWGGSGVNQYHVGWTYNTDTLAKGVSASSRDIIWDWSASDVLDVSATGVAVLGLLRGQSDWNAANTVDLSGINVTNSGVIVVALGAGNDVIHGSSGVDYISGGASTGVGNQLWGGAGADYFFSGFNYDPVTAAATNDASGLVALGAGEVGLDVIRDWQNNADRLMVGQAGKVVIGGLYGVNGWSDNNTVDVSSNADNQGVIVIAAGAGANQIYGSNGSDQYWVGYQYLPSSDVINGGGGPTASSAATDNIWLWDDQSSRRDSLYVAAGSVAQIAGLQGVNGWSGNNTVDLRAQVTNLGLIRVAAGAGNNTLFGSTGSDEFNVGYEVSTNISFGQIVASSGAAVDTIYGWNARNWVGNTWDAGTNWNGHTDGTDTVYDRLNVAEGSVAFIASLSGMDPTDSGRWAGNDTVDLRSNVSNNGEIVVWTGDGNDIVYGSAGRDLIYAGSGLDNLYGGDGHDLFYVGYSPVYAPYGADNAEARIWDWQNGTSNVAPGDGLRIAANSVTVIAGLYCMDPQNSNRWAGNDTVDLRWNVLNEGKIIVATGAGNDVIYGSAGVDWLNGGTGLNTYDLSAGGADRVYIDNYLGQQQITGFGANDKIYLDSRILDSFRTSLGIQTISGYNITQTTDLTTAALTAGQAYNNGNFSLSEMTYDAAYNRVLSAFNGNPATVGFSVFGSTFGWQSNGAWNNDAYAKAYDLARAALISASAASLAIGYGLMAIPFVGPLLAIAPLTIGGLMLNDALNNIDPHQNATYSGVWSSGIDMLNSNLSPSSTVGAWDNVNFLSFFQNPNDKFVTSLEITGQQIGVTGNQVGVASYVTVFNGTETFIYLVYSRDGLIQNNEARLLAQVNGRVTADQLVMFDGSTDAEYQRYFNSSIDAPVFPPNATVLDNGYAAHGAAKVLYSVSYTQAATDLTAYVDFAGLSALRLNTANVTNLVVTNVLTNDRNPTLTFTLDNALVAGNVVSLYLNGSAIAAQVWNGSDVGVLGATSLAYTFASLSDGGLDYTVKVTNAQSFETHYSGHLTVQATAPDITKIVVTDTAASLIVVSHEAGSTALYSGVNLVGAAVPLTDNNGDQGAVSLVAQSSVKTLALQVLDIFGQTTTVLGSVILGTLGDDTLNESAAVTSNYIYGFDGADVITAGTHGDVIYGGAGNDTIYAGIGADKIAGGAGADVIVLPSAGASSAAHTLVYAVDAAPGVGHGTSDSNHDVRDTVSGFVAGRDVISVAATGVTSFDPSANVDVQQVAGHYIGTLMFNGGTDLTYGGDLQIDFGTSSISLPQLQGALQYNLTGSDSGSRLVGGALADQLTGGAGNDTLTGGQGGDNLTGGGGSNTFVFAAGDSIPVINDSVASGFDVITDITLLGAGTGNKTPDTVQLARGFTIAADTSGFNGIDFGNIKSDAITNGKITFSTSDTYASAPLTAADSDLTNILGYLHSNITVDHQAVVFATTSNAYVFQHNSGGDLLIELAGASAIAGMTTSLVTPPTNYLFIA